MTYKNHYKIKENNQFYLHDGTQSYDAPGKPEQSLEYEDEDNTTGTQELSCTAGACELVDITSSVAA